MPIVLAAAIGMASPVRAQDESQLKAAFVYQFAQFVEWPAGALDRRQTLEFCVWPPNPFGTVLADLVRGESLQGRPLAVRVLTPNAALTSCSVLYLHGSETAAALGRVGRQATLTIGDSPRFLDEGGIIQLVRVDNRLRFNISLEAADRAGLRLSSRLLELAGNLRRPAS